MRMIVELLWLTICRMAARITSLMILSRTAIIELFMIAIGYGVRRIMNLPVMLSAGLILTSYRIATISGKLGGGLSALPAVTEILSRPLTVVCRRSLSLFVNHLCSYPG